jgi:hypothetical protein
MAQEPLVGHDLFIVEASRSHSDTPHSVGVPWTSDQPDAENYTSQHTKHSQETAIHAPDEIRTHNPTKQVATDPPLRPRGHWDQPVFR